MKIAIFAARKTHRHYANKLSGYLRHSGASQTSVLWYKNLWQTPYWLLSLLKTPSASLSRIALDYVRTKQNSPIAMVTGRKRFYLLFPFKLIESRLLYSIYYYALKSRNISHLIIWNGLKFRQRIAVMAARDLGIPSMYIERGLFPGTTTLDPQGINYLNSVPREPAAYPTCKNYVTQTTCTEERPSSLPSSYIFVPFQVNTDSQIVMFSPWVKNMFDLIKHFEEAEKALGSDMPHIVFKPHPACEQDYSELIQEINSRPGHLHIELDTPTTVLIEHADAVCTINSSVGMEAILMNKKVLVLGQAFYGIDGLTLIAQGQKSLQESLIKFRTWTPDQSLRSGFLTHIRDEHVVPGSWQNPDDHHMDYMASRILSFTQ